MSKKSTTTKADSSATLRNAYLRNVDGARWAKIEAAAALRGETVAMFVEATAVVVAERIIEESARASRAA